MLVARYEVLDGILVAGALLPLDWSTFCGSYFVIDWSGYMTWQLWGDGYVPVCRLFLCSYVFMVLPRAYCMTSGFAFCRSPAVRLGSGEP